MNRGRTSNRPGSSLIHFRCAAVRRKRVTKLRRPIRVELHIPGAGPLVQKVDINIGEPLDAFLLGEAEQVLHNDVVAGVDGGLLQAPLLQQDHLILLPGIRDRKVEHLLATGSPSSIRRIFSLATTLSVVLSDSRWYSLRASFSHKPNGALALPKLSRREAVFLCAQLSVSAVDREHKSTFL